MVFILIPAYNPSKNLVEVVKNLKGLGFDYILVVNDGSKNECNSIFEKLKNSYDCLLLYHTHNQGKGKAIKTGIQYIIQSYPECTGIITVDADGQHLPEDVKKVFLKFQEHPNALVLGVRDFQQKNIPLRSKFGNILTRKIFAIMAGYKLSDTQTGLRAIPINFAQKLLCLKENRYEFEMKMLLMAKEMVDGVYEIPISTVYVEDNISSHFNPILDSLKIYFVLLRFVFSSLSSSFIDFIVFTFVFLVTNSISLGILIARLISGTYNFIVNKHFVFKNKRSFIFSFFLYWLLVIILGAMSYLGIKYLNFYTKINVLIAKIIVETFLFLLSFFVQKEIIFVAKNKLFYKK
ncbi:MAG: glycosyltransferase [Brevinematales bacterium]